MHRVMAREREIGIGVKPKGKTVFVGCVATGKCQNVKWLGKGGCGECALLSLGKALWEESRKPRGNSTGQDRGPAGGGGGNRKGVVGKAQGIPGVKLLGRVLGFAPFLPFN